MKKMILALALCLAAAAAQAQTWKLLPVFSDEMSMTYLSFGYPDDEETGEGDIFFSLWGLKEYGSETFSPFEVEYFRANPRGMHDFLLHVRDFSERYKSEAAVSHKFGVQVKTFHHPITGNYTAVYGPDGRDLCMYKPRRWATVYDDFVAFCEHNNIELGE